MALWKGTTPLERERALLLKKETRFLDRRAQEKTSWFTEKLDAVVPEKLQATLNFAFCKAFQTVFEKGSGVIEKTYNKEKQEYTYQVNSFAMGLKASKKNIRAFSRQADASAVKNMALASVEGIGTGLFGIGIPDILLFTAVLLKSVYEIAISFGFDYRSEEEQKFILKVIGTSFEYGEALRRDDRTINEWIAQNSTAAGEAEMIPAVDGFGDRNELVKWTAEKLSGELLYMKFVQGFPIVGIVGGLSDTVCLMRVADYAGLKYRRRFLTSKNGRKA